MNENTVMQDFDPDKQPKSPWISFGLGTLLKCCLSSSPGLTATKDSDFMLAREEGEINNHQCVDSAFGFSLFLSMHCAMTFFIYFF